jgi:ABC-2 type transport system permease protein
MKKIWIIAKRELNVFFDSLIAYLIVVLFLGFTGLFTWLFGSDVFLIGQASMQSFFGVAYWTLFFFIPAITMRMIAEEKKTGTIELLLTKSVTEWQVILGKFLSGLLLIGIILALTLPYYITIAFLGKIDHGAVWCGYLGLLLMSSTYLSIGIFTSSISNNQIVGLLFALFIGIFFHLIFGFIAISFRGITGEIFGFLSITSHFESISRGMVDSKDLIFFFSVTLLGLAFTEKSLSKRNAAN